MSRRTNVVNIKHDPRLRSSLGAIDIHFHGAFGVDLMTASEAELRTLSSELWRHGVAGFCPTTLSSPPGELAAAVERIGKWIRKGHFPGARPIGIHLEGPFISKNACGAHPPHTIRKLSESELENLWHVSQGTLKILTVAPENLAPTQLKQLVRWCRPKKIVLSLGHSKADSKQAEMAFTQGFSGVTHAWNALSFHQRAPGVLGAALGRDQTYIELIVDQIHVDPQVVQWTLQLHPKKQVCFISDCLSAGGFEPKSRTRPGPWLAFGALQIRFENGACRLKDGHLGGGGLILPKSFGNWVTYEAQQRGVSVDQVLKQRLPCITTNPLRALAVSERSFSDLRVRWRTSTSGEILAIPVDSTASSG